MDIKAWITRLKKRTSGEKLPRKTQLLILLLAGILLLVITLPVPGTASDTDTNEMDREEGELSSDDPSAGEYEKMLEEKTEQILGQVEGVGKVSVMVTLKSDGQRIVEKDQSTNGQNTEESDSSGGTRSVSDQTTDKTSIYLQNADGSTEPYVSKELLPEVEGVVIIAQGGDNAVVKQNITEAIQALFGVEAHKIKIMKRASYIEGG